MIPDFVKAIWEVISKCYKLLWTLVTNAWPVLLAVSTFLGTMWEQIKTAFAAVYENIAAAVAVLVDAEEGAATAMSAGWPGWMANGLGYINQYFPVAECAAFFGVMITTLLLMTTLRVVKSCLPTVAS